MKRAVLTIVGAIVFVEVAERLDARRRIRALPWRLDYDGRERICPTHDSDSIRDIRAWDQWNRGVIR